MEFLNQILASIQENYWATQALSVLVLTLIISKIFDRLLGKLKRKFKRTKNVWDSTIVTSVKTPLYFLVIAVGLTFCAEIIYNELEFDLFSIAPSIRKIATIILIGWFLLKLIKEAQKNIIAEKLKSQSKIDRKAIDVTCNIASILVVVIIGLVTLQTFGVQIGGILALGGVGGIAVGFAAKDLLSNFFGGLMLYFDHPFQVGDWVRSPDKDIEGTVVRIGWRQTEIRNFSNRPLYVPNSVFSTIVVENPSRMTNRRIYETIGVRYEDADKVAKIVDDVKEMILNNKEIDQSQTIIVNVNSFAASSIDFIVYIYTVTVNWVEFHRVKQDILLKIAKIIEGNGAEIAFPTSTIHLADSGNIPFKEKL